MKLIKISLLVLLAFDLAALARAEGQIHWSVVLEQPGQPGVEVGSFEGWPDHPLSFGKKIGDIQVDVEIKQLDNLVTFEAKASSASETTCFLSLQSSFKEGVLYSYLGEAKGREVFRQSPHDPGGRGLGHLLKQAIPMFAIKDTSGFAVAINDTPALYDNFTTQTLDTPAKTAMLSSGDSGEAAPPDLKIQKYYHPIGPGQTHVFNGVLCQSKAQNLNDLRADVLLAIARRWGQNVTGRFGATAFASNYMLIRVNETGKSHYWVVAGLEYSNKAYTRDSFWQSMVLPPEFARESYLNEARSGPTGAERPLFCLIWAYRNKLDGSQPDLESAAKTLHNVEREKGFRVLVRRGGF
jgi:hypothetical protein